MTASHIHLMFITTIITLATKTTSCVQVESIWTTKENVFLKGEVMQRQRTTNFVSCAHLCLRKEGCRSINYQLSPKMQGICELLSDTAGHFDDGITEAAGWLHGRIVRSGERALIRSIKTDVYVTFTSLGAKGRKGPTNTSGYRGTSLEGKVQLESGIQIWTVPATGVYSVEAWGASGAPGTADGGLKRTVGGKGARIKGLFQLNAGEKVKILVGQRGQLGSDSLIPGGGGGGTFVIRRNDKPLVIAGGGGGGAAFESANVSLNGDDGQATENGTRHGGYNGSGGNLCPLSKKDIQGSGGGGFRSDGERSATCQGGNSFLNGGYGGLSHPGVSNGGFGGGGAATTHPGGGGGFSGGGIEAKNHSVTVAGGGGSFNGGRNQENYEGVRSGDGQVTIKLMK